MNGPLPLTGTLGTWDIPSILIQMHAQGLSGILNIRRGVINRELIIEGDRIRQINSPEDADRFDQFLLDRNLISKAQWQSLEKTMKSKQLRFTRVLIETSLFTPDRLWELILAHQKQLLFPIFPWADGRFDIACSAQSSREGKNWVCIDQPIHSLLLEGIRLIEDEVFLSQRFQNCPEFVLVNVNDSAIQILKDYERYVLYLVRDHSILGEILTRSELSNVMTLRILFYFLLTGILAPKKESVPLQNVPRDRNRIQSFHTFEEALNFFNTQYEYIYWVLSKEIGPVAGSILHDAVLGIIDRLPPYLRTTQVTENGRIDEKPILKAMWFVNFEQSSGEFLTALEEILYAEIFSVKKHLGREYEQAILQWIRDNGND